MKYFKAFYGRIPECDDENCPWQTGLGLFVNGGLTI
jgi:hypothetical protein